MSRHEDTYDWAGLMVQALVRAEFPPAAAILDVGPGFGKYRILLPEYPMDACEAWEPTIVAENLGFLYDRVFVADIADHVQSALWHRYDLVIMGDVFEHLTREAAKRVLARVLADCGELLVATPFQYPQGPEHGNPYQRHLQDDLTPELMAQQFPELELVAVEHRDGTPFKGLYRRKAAA